MAGRRQVETHNLPPTQLTLIIVLITLLTTGSRSSTLVSCHCHNRYTLGLRFHAEWRGVDRSNKSARINRDAKWSYLWGWKFELQSSSTKKILTLCVFVAG